ncbi:hypothetical protein [Bacillus litorisediminis]|uniref:hypothetical protein n=1 Tax=Bacillus litorisediminis TaxID=2922713 RepID=UPI001FAD7456|nr:hypothetical protein [Bacillus litorisediminis]
MKDKNNEEEQLKCPLAGSRRTKARGRNAEMSIMRVMKDKSKRKSSRNVRQQRYEGQKQEEEQPKCPSTEL